MKNPAFKRFQEKIERAIESYNAYEINWHKDYCSIDYPVFLEDFSWFSSTEGEESYEDFKEEYTDYIHLNRDNPETLRKYLLDIYVEGLKFKVFQLKHIQKSLSEKGATLKDEMLVNLINFIHSIGTIINSISSYIQRNANLKIPEIKEDGFNIIGEYFTGFELIYDKEKFETATISNQETEQREEESEIAQKVKLHFEFFRGNCPRKHEQILKDEDFDKLIEWTEYYYENHFEIPEIKEPIRVVNTNKTYVQLAFKYLFKQLHKSSPYPKSLFEFYKRAFFPYSEDKRHSFEGVRNNHEVNKLMKIEY